MLRNIIKIYIFNKFSKPLNIYAFIETIVKIHKFESTYAVAYNPFLVIVMLFYVRKCILCFYKSVNAQIFHAVI